MKKNKVNYMYITEKANKSFSLLGKLSGYIIIAALIVICMSCVTAHQSCKKASKERNAFLYCNSK